MNIQNKKLCKRINVRAWCMILFKQLVKFLPTTFTKNRQSAFFTGQRKFQAPEEKVLNWNMTKPRRI